MTLASRPASVDGAHRLVTTTDAWKLFAIVFVLIDHCGMYFDAGETWWRLFGRLASPVFFFFIGFAHRRTVPWVWIVLGIAITATDHWTSGGRNLLVNILVNFALLRLVLPFVEAHVMPYPWRLAFLVTASAAVSPALDTILEYGGGGWLWALFGLSHRLLLDHGDSAASIRRNCLAAAAGLAYVVRERFRFGFDDLQTALLALSIAVLALSLMRFRRQDLAWQPTSPVNALFSFVGRRTLEIYAATLLAMQFTAFAMSGAATEAEHDPIGKVVSTLVDHALGCART